MPVVIAVVERREHTISKLIPYAAIFAGLVIVALAIPGAIDTLSVAMAVGDYQSTDALVLSHRAKSHQRGPDTVIVKFRFETQDGRTVEGDNRWTRITDSPEEVERLVRREGGQDRIRVWYDPADPSRAVIKNRISVWRPLLMIALSLFLIVGGVRAHFVERKRRRLRERAAESRRRRRAGGD